MINEHLVGTYISLERANYPDIDTLDDLFVYVVSVLDAVGASPNRLAITAAGAPKNYGNINTRQRWLENHGWAAVEHFSMCHLLKPGGHEDSEWSVHIIISRYFMNVDFGWVPDVLASNEAPLWDLLYHLIRQMSPRYGYLFRQQMRFGPLWYASGVGYGDASQERARELRMNISHWQLCTTPAAKVSRADEIYDSGLLRDIYAENYLREKHLKAPVGRGGSDLRRWIEANPSVRGELEPITNEITAWRPPTEWIPAIREELFRAGRVFYWKFFQPTRRREKLAGARWVNWDDPANHEPEPFYRADLFEPWESPEPIPEIFRADFYDGKDPGLIY